MSQSHDENPKEPKKNYGTRCQPYRSKRDNNTVLNSLITGSISSTVTTLVYQPLELLKTRIQIRDDIHLGNASQTVLRPVIGRATQSAISLSRNNGILSLWKGTGASLVRSVPGVGLYYALLNALQTNFSGQNNRPNDATQAFYFGLAARSIVSFLLLPITVVKVRYESGRFKYPSLTQALRGAYMNSSGWIGLAPTILRDSLFSGIYYMIYTQLKLTNLNQPDHQPQGAIQSSGPNVHVRNVFYYGIVSGLIASVLTNPFDVLKTNIQVSSEKTKGVNSMRQVSYKLLNEPKGYMHFFDGLVPRTIRRTLIAASTWTFYELTIDLVSNQRSG